MGLFFQIKSKKKGLIMYSENDFELLTKEKKIKLYKNKPKKEIIVHVYEKLNKDNFTVRISILKKLMDKLNLKEGDFLDMLINKYNNKIFLFRKSKGSQYYRGRRIHRYTVNYNSIEFTSENITEQDAHFYTYEITDKNDIIIDLSKKL